MISISKQIMRGQSKSIWGNLNLAFWLPVVWMCVLLFAVVFADALPFRDPTESDFTALKARPGQEFWLGTDVLGRDIFSRIIHGARISLTVGFVRQCSV